MFLCRRNIIASSSEIWGIFVNVHKELLVIWNLSFHVWLGIIIIIIMMSISFAALTSVISRWTLEEKFQIYAHPSGQYLFRNPLPLPFIDSRNYTPSSAIFRSISCHHFWGQVTNYWQICAKKNAWKEKLKHLLWKKDNSPQQLAKRLPFCSVYSITK